MNVGGEDNYWLPYSAASIWSYVKQFNDITETYDLKDIFFQRLHHSEVLDFMESPFVVGFSCYIWNHNYCLALAEKIKEKWPECYIIFGGSQASGQFLKHEFIDSIAMGEGEEIFLQILRTLNKNEPIQQIYNKARLDSLEIPSPYLDGTMDEIVKKHPNVMWSTTIETNRGCPYSCTFCDWGSVTYSKVKKFNLERIQLELDWVSKHKVGYLFGADANFGILKERDVEIVKLMRSAADKGTIEAINLQFAKNNTENIFEIGKILGPYSRGITVSVQSMNPDTLKAIKRKNLDVNDIETVLSLSEKHGVGAYTEVILGLPLENVESWKKGLTDLLELGQHHNIDLAIAEMLENSELSSFESRQKYNIKTIKAKNYYSLHIDDYPETSEIVCSTSTMDLKGMVESYMYSWMIIHIHVNGYTQLFSKYLNKVHKIPYRIFYDKLFTKIKNCGVFGPHYQELERAIDHYFHTGELTLKVQKGDSLHFFSHKFCYDNRQALFYLGAEIFSEFDLDVNDIKFLQENLIFNDKISDPKPYKIKSNINLDNWSKEICQYVVSNSMFNLDKENYQSTTLKDKKYKKIDFWVMRRRNLLKNIFIKTNVY